MAKTLVIGSSVCDCIINVDVLPNREGDAHVRTQHTQIGGCALNVAATLKSLGADVDFLSPVGSGVYGDFVAGELEKLGLPVFRVPGDNGCCYCFVEADGERTFLSYHGVEYSFQREWLNRYDLSQYDYVYVCGLEVEEPTGKALVDALGAMVADSPQVKVTDSPQAKVVDSPRQKVVDSPQIVFCPGPRVALIDSDRINQLLSYQPILHINEQEASIMSGKSDIREAMLALYKRTHAPVIVTLGAQGVIAYDGEWTNCDQTPVTVCDTVGAGDSHIGGFLAGRTAGLTMHDSLQFANAVAAQVVQVSGCQLSADTYQSLQKQLIL